MTRYLISFSVHALLIGNVVSPLDFPPDCISRAACHGGTAKETTPGPDCGTSACITRGSANRRTKSSSYKGTDRRSASKFFIDGLTWWHSSLL
jgi:hypothetical protein